MWLPEFPRAAQYMDLGAHEGRPYGGIRRAARCMNPGAHKGRPYGRIRRAARCMDLGAHEGRPYGGIRRAAQYMDLGAHEGRPYGGIRRAARCMNPGAHEGRPYGGIRRAARCMNPGAHEGRPYGGIRRAARCMNPGAHKGRPYGRIRRAARCMDPGAHEGRPYGGIRRATGFVAQRTAAGGSTRGTAMNDERITPHFHAREFACPCGRADCDAPPIYRPLVTHVLEPARRALGRPVVVTSGARCAAHNAAVGGAPDSRHLTGHAADVTVAGADGRRRLVRLFALLELARGPAADAAPGPTGLGLYLHPGHVHVDYGPDIPWRRWVVGRDGRPAYF